MPAGIDTLADFAGAALHLVVRRKQEMFAARARGVGARERQSMAIALKSQPPNSSRPRNLIKQTMMQTSALRRYPGIALWDTGSTEDAMVAANIIHLPLTR